MRFFKRGETNEPIDILDPLYKITYFDGPNEISIVSETTLQKVAGDVGVYIVNWIIPDYAIENETYFVTAKGTHPIDATITVIEDFYRVLPASFFEGGGGAGGGIVAKFTKP